MPVSFYPSKIYGGTKQYPYNPESITQYVMLNPIYQVKSFYPNTIAICDSGAFQDIDKHNRLTPEQALHRQLKYRDKIRTYINQEWDYEAYCIYDQMIGVDECIVDGKKVKRRGTIETGKKAIEDTLESAQYYYTQKNVLSKIVYIAQGVTADQYIDCTNSLMDMCTQNDYFGFGGFCIIGRQRKTMLPLFYETCTRVLEILKKKGIQRAHILGVCIPEAITYAAKEGKKFGITISTDSSAPEVNAVAFGKIYSDDMRLTTRDWDKWIDYNPIYLAYENVRRYSAWAMSL